jgi:glycerol-3-phosphate O-acyltransferase
VEWKALGKEDRTARLTELGDELRSAMGRLVPALPVSLVATALLQGTADHPAPGGSAPVSTLDLHACTQALMRRLQAAGAHVYLPRADEEYAMDVGLRMLVQRRLVEERGGGWVVAEGEAGVLRYYANAIAPLLAACDTLPVARPG